MNTIIKKKTYQCGVAFMALMCVSSISQAMEKDKAEFQEGKFYKFINQQSGDALTVQKDNGVRTTRNHKKFDSNMLFQLKKNDKNVYLIENEGKILKTLKGKYTVLFAQQNDPESEKYCRCYVDPKNKSDNFYFIQYEGGGKLHVWEAVFPHNWHYVIAGKTEAFPRYKRFEIELYKPDTKEDQYALGDLYFKRKNFGESYKIFKELYYSGYEIRSISEKLNSKSYIDYKIDKIKNNELYIASSDFYMYIINGDKKIGYQEENKGNEFSPIKIENDLEIKFGNSYTTSINISGRKYTYIYDNHLTLTEIVQKLSKIDPFVILDYSTPTFIENGFTVGFCNRSNNAYKITLSCTNSNAVTSPGTSAYVLNKTAENNLNYLSTLMSARLNINHEFKIRF